MPFSQSPIDAASSSGTEARNGGGSVIGNSVSRHHAPQAIRAATPGQNRRSAIAGQNVNRERRTRSKGIHSVWARTGYAKAVILPAPVLNPSMEEVSSFRPCNPVPGIVVGLDVLGDECIRPPACQAAVGERGLRVFLGRRQ